MQLWDNGAGLFNEEAFLKKRVEGWARLDALALKAAGAIRSLTGDELVEFVRLYRQASADLAFLMTHSSNQDVVTYLNGIVGRSYGQIYQARSRRFGEVVSNGFASAAQTVRRRRRPIYLSLGIFLAATFAAAAVVSLQPEAVTFFIPPEFAEVRDHWKSGDFEARTGEQNLAMTAFYASNNPMVGIMTNALGFATAGVMTALMLWQNGALLGALAADVASVGQLGHLLSSIFPHGVSEIGGIIVAGGAAFALGGAIIAPGDRTRMDAIKEAGKDGLTLLILSLIMIVLAAPIEGFFSFNPAIPQWLKVVAGSVALAAWLAYFIGYAKQPDEGLPQAAEPVPGTPSR